MSQFFSDSIFWVEIEKVHPNPFQPRKEFDESKLRELADSIRQYGILQPMVVTRNETVKPDGGLLVEYELISGERRLRASKIAGLSQVPVLIRSSQETDQIKLELAIIENLQREDLNCVDRAKAFQRLVEEFHFKHAQIGLKVGRSREYVTNSLRILMLPEHMLTGLSEGKISEGHTRPLLMLADRKEEQEVLFKEIYYKKLTVREAELTARKIAVERARNKESIPDPEIAELEGKLSEKFGTRVHIETKQSGGKITIDFFSKDDLEAILKMVNEKQSLGANSMLNNHAAKVGDISEEMARIEKEEAPLMDDRSLEEKKKQEEEEEMYSVRNFTL